MYESTKGQGGAQWILCRRRVGTWPCSAAMEAGNALMDIPDVLFLACQDCTRSFQSDCCHARTCCKRNVVVCLVGRRWSPVSVSPGNRAKVSVFTMFHPRLIRSNIFQKSKRERCKYVHGSGGGAADRFCIAHKPHMELYRCILLLVFSLNRNLDMLARTSVGVQTAAK